MSTPFFSLQSSLFHPYLSLQQMELLKSAHVRSFVVGASNYLYKRQKGLSEVLVDVSKFKIKPSWGYDMATLTFIIWWQYKDVFQSVVPLCLESCSKYVISVSILLGLNGAELEEKFSSIQPIKAKLFYSQPVRCKTCWHACWQVIPFFLRVLLIRCLCLPQVT